MRKIYILLLFPLFIQAESYLVTIEKQQEEKRSNRWTIADWFSTKNKVRLMDQWLAMHRSESNIFDLYVGANMGTWQEELTQNGVTSEQDITWQSAEAGFGLWIFGAEAAYELDGKDSERFKAQNLWGHIRLIGDSLQSTNLRAIGGIRLLELTGNGSIDEYENIFWGGILTLYVFDFLGFEMGYRQYVAAESETGIELEGQRLDRIVFLELWALRFYANFFREDLNFTVAGSNSSTRNQGLLAGARIYLF